LLLVDKHKKIFVETRNIMRILLNTIQSFTVHFLYCTKFYYLTLFIICGNILHVTFFIFSPIWIFIIEKGN